jgi:dihydroflavonol-4-reductase
LNLVTGATGILGSHVVLTLLQNNQVVIACRQKNSDIKKVEELFAYYSKNSKVLFEKIKWIDVDVQDIFSIEEALEGITHVYHCAGFVSFNSKDRKKLMEINEKGTKNVVDACLHKNIQALCHVSSLATINNSDYILALNEDVFWKTSGKESDYAISKYNAEREVWRGIEEGLNAVIVNPGVILSPGFWGQSSSRLFETSYKRNRFYTRGTTAYVAASDVAGIMVALVSKKCFGQRYIVIEDNYSFQNILDCIQGNFNKPLPHINAPKMLLNAGRMAEGVLAFFTGKEPRLTKALVHSVLNKQLYSNQKVKKELNFEFQPVYQIIEQICRHHLLQKPKA